MRADILNLILKKLELPEDCKTKVRERYTDLGKWLNREDSSIKQYEPYVFPQGSFLLQTAIRPYNREDDYDLDLGCKFTNGASIYNTSQKDLRDKLRVELERYRQARNIQAKIEEKKRCLRIEYQDGIKFHIDVVPCIPETEVDISMRRPYYEDVTAEGELLISDETVSQWKKLSVLITDNENSNYCKISSDWHHSNPEGFAKWFRASSARSMTKEAKSILGGSMEVADLPTTTSSSTTVLHKIIKLLKRHRDVMFAIRNSDFKPISVIISCLAAKVYNGETDLPIALLDVIEKMIAKIESISNSVCNPTQELENFADKWKKSTKYKKCFLDWLLQAKADFSNLCKAATSRDTIVSILKSKMDLHVASEDIKAPEKTSPVRKAVSVQTPSKLWHE